MVQCVKLHEELARSAVQAVQRRARPAHLRHDLGQQAWQEWIEHSKKIVNEYRLDLTTEEGARRAEGAVRGVPVRRRRLVAAGLRATHRRSWPRPRSLALDAVHASALARDPRAEIGRGDRRAACTRFGDLRDQLDEREVAVARGEGESALGDRGEIRCERAAPGRGGSLRAASTVTLRAVRRTAARR